MKKYDYQDRSIRFAGDVILFVQPLDWNNAGNYLNKQITRSSGSAALNFAESQGSITDKDYLHKFSIALKELRKTEVNLRIMEHIGLGGETREKIHTENIELLKILSTIIKNRKARI